MFIFNSKLINGFDISLSINSASLNYGFSLFETVKLFNAKPQMLKEHIYRLNTSLKCLNMNHKVELKSIEYDIEELIGALDVEEGALKIMILENEGCYNTLITYANRVYKDELYNNGYKIMLSEYKSNESSLFTYHKTCNYGDNIFALRDAKSKGFDEIIFENSKGYISEGSLSNIFLVKNNLIYTPNIESGILNGVMRDLVISSLDELDIKIIETELSYSDFLEADEVFLSNSLMKVMPVSKLDEKNFDIKSYKIYKKIRKQLHLVLKEDYFG
ncbi:MAG: aminotransferase class IV [Acidaminobacteraceae bacterium]